MLPGKLVARITALPEPQLRELESHVKLTLAIHSLNKSPTRLNYTADQEDFLSAIGKHSTFLGSDSIHLAGMVARKCTRQSIMKAYEAVHLLIKRAKLGDLKRVQRIALYEILAIWACRYREARSPVLDSDHCAQLLGDIQDVVDGRSPERLLGWAGILKTRIYRRQTTPQVIITELYNPLTILNHCFPQYDKASIHLLLKRAMKGKFNGSD